MSSAVSLVLSALGDRVVSTGEKPTARCPSHDDDRASLSIGEGTDGRVLLHCHAGCDVASVVGAIGLTTVDLMPGYQALRSRSGTRGRIVATYDYRDEAGNLLYQTVRFEPKDFRQRRPEGDGWSWTLGDVRRVLYRLPELRTSAPDAAVFVVEGEKDADALSRLGLLATTNQGGVGGGGQWRVPAFRAPLHGRPIVILPDNDTAGRAHAQRVAHALAGDAASLKVIVLAGLPDKGDVSDWLAAGGTAPDLLALVESALLYGGGGAAPGGLEGAEEEGAGAATDRPGITPAAAWTAPASLPEGLSEVPAFDARLLPDALRPWLSDVAERAQCPLDYPAIGAVIALSALVGRSCAIRPKRQDDWTVVPNLWGAVVGPPSSMKTPALTEALKPLHRLAAQATEDYQRRLGSHPAALAEAETRRAVIKGKMKKAATNTKVAANMEELRAEFTSATDPDPPTERRYVVNDATVEKLGELLNQNPRGLLHFRDELTGWLAILDRDGHENDRAFFLEAWNGAGRYTYDRIGRGTLHIGAACVSLLGGIQPGPLAQYLRATTRGGSGDDGLMQRFQLLVYPDAPKVWRNVDRWPDGDAKNQAFALFERLDTLAPETLGAQVGDDGLPYRRFSPEAQEFFDGWREALMTRLRAGGEHPALEAHLAKYPSLLPSLALLFHLVDGPGPTPGPVTLTSAQRAAAWCDYLEAHARRIYGAVIEEKLRAARTLLGKLREGGLKPTFTLRDVYRAGWSGLADREVVTEAVDILEDHGWVRRVVTCETGGRPKTEYLVHPALAATSTKAVAA